MILTDEYIDNISDMWLSVVWNCAGNEDIINFLCMTNRLDRLKAIADHSVNDNKTILLQCLWNNHGS